MKCNKCKSSNVQKFQVIHEQGTSNINIDSNTVGGGVGFFLFLLFCPSNYLNRSSE
jgi:hypothetical protein